jgi:large subunit ribosomal protein L19
MNRKNGQSSAHHEDSRHDCLGRKEIRIMDLVKALSEQHIKTDLPELKVGDTVKVHAKIKEGTRERIQIFEGTIIAMKHTGVNKSVTVRRVSYGVGVEKTFPVHSPNIAKFEVIRHGRVRRAKLYYLRDRVGKAAKVQEKL